MNDLHPMLTTLKRRIPEPLLAAARQVRAQSRHLLAWQGRSLVHELPSGLSVQIRSASDWAIYNEVFVEGEYDRAITAITRAAAPDPLVIDLGANVGLFALRFADAWRRANGSAPFRVLSVEGCPATYAQLARNLNQPALDGRCTAIHGLVGQRQGHGSISVSVLTGLNSMYTRQSLSRARVPFADLEQLVPREQAISLLKCDIEGAEGAFIDTYPSLLRRVGVLVIEFHHELCDVVRCRELLREAGLIYRTLLRTYDRCSVELFSRVRLEDGTL